MEFAFFAVAEQLPVGIMTPTKPIIWQGSEEAPLLGLRHLHFASGHQA
jgi:hypothetical protein